MEEDNQDGPFTVWQMFNAPTMVLFNNLEHAADGLDRLLTSILKLSGDFSEVLVPRPGLNKYPDTYYSSFNIWLLGRLFYVWSVKELNRIHVTSKDAQLKILGILCMNGATFYENIHSEYSAILVKLIQYYKESPQNEKSKELVLENFSSENVNIPNVQLNLEPIYVTVNNLKTCETLIDLTLQLLSESLPINSINIDRCTQKYKELFNQIIYMLENYSLELKLTVLKFFTNLIDKYNQIGLNKFCNLFPSTYTDLLCSIEAMTKAMNVYYEKGELSMLYMDSYNKLMLSLLKTSETKGFEEVLTNICTVILQAKDSTIFHKELKLYCLTLSNKLDLPRDVIAIKNLDSSQINALVKCYSQGILEELQNKSIAEVRENWYYIQVLDVIKILKSCEECNIDAFLIQHYLKSCHAAFQILVTVYLKRQKQTEDECQILNTDTGFCIWTSLLKAIQNHKSIIIKDKTNLQLVMEITMMTAILFRNMPKEDSNVILQILCLQSTAQFSEQNLGYPDSTKVLILKYMMLVKLVLKSKLSDTWVRIISHLISSLIRNKSTEVYKEVLPLCPFLLMNKIYSASKLIGEILMPALLAKDENLQKELIKILQAISCMSLATTSVIISTPEDELGHTIFSNNAITVLAVCSKCHADKNEGNCDGFLSKMRKEVEIYSVSNIATPSQHSNMMGLKSLFTKFLNSKHYVDVETSGFWNLADTLCHHFFVFDHTEDLNRIENSGHVLRALKPFLCKDMVSILFNFRDRMRNSVIREHCEIKEDVVTGIEKGMLRWFRMLGWAFIKD